MSDSPFPDIRIIADDRERRGKVSDELRQIKGIEVVIRRLGCGDYMVEDKLVDRARPGLVFERKTLPDMAASIKDGRLFSQAMRLVKAACHPIIVIEGSGSDFHQTFITAPEHGNGILRTTKI